MVENTVGKKKFSFCLSVFKRLELQTRKNKGLFGKGLTIYLSILKVNKPEEVGFQKHNGKNEYIHCLTLSQTSNFRHFKTERVCRQQFHI